MLERWPVEEFYKVYGHRLTPARSTVPAASPLPVPRDLGEDAARLRREALRSKLPSIVREIRASVSELRGVAAQGRTLHGEMVWTRQHQRATAFGGVIHCCIASGRPTNRHDILVASGCLVPPGWIPVWLEHSAEHVIGLAETFMDDRRVYAEIALTAQVHAARATPRISQVRPCVNDGGCPKGICMVVAQGLIFKIISGIALRP